MSRSAPQPCMDICTKYPPPPHTHTHTHSWQVTIALIVSGKKQNINFRHG